MLRNLMVFMFAAGLAFPAAALDDDDAKQKLLEETTADRIGVLTTEIVALAKTCAATPRACDHDKLAQDRFELLDQMATAKELRSALAKQIADEKSANKVEALDKRDLALVAKMEPARDISFTAHDDQVEGDELLDEVKAVGRSLTEAEEAEDKAAQKRLAKHLANLEQKLRAQGVEDRDAIDEIDKTLKSGKLDLDYGKLVAKRKHFKTRLAQTQSLMTLPRTNPLYRVYDDDADEWWIHQFYLGVEFDSVSGIFNKGFPRIGYSNSLHVGGEGIPESHPVSGLKNYGHFWEFNALLTSSAEQDVKASLGANGASAPTDPCSTGTTSSDPCLRRAFEVEEKLFWPLYRTNRHAGMRLYAGPIAAIGAKFVDRKPAPDGSTAKSTTDDSAHADYRYYLGIHSGFGRDLYSEFIYGRTRSLHTRRIEVRGEVPVAHWGTDSRLLLGWVANFRAGRPHNRPQSDPPERDVFRVYVTYDLDFLKLIGLKAPKPE